MACWPVCDYAGSCSSFLRAQHVSYDAAEAMGEILEESCLLALAATKGSSPFGSVIPGTHNYDATRVTILNGNTRSVILFELD
jgi:hypothetical protein